MAAVRLRSQGRSNVADTFFFCNEALTVLVDQDTAVIGDEPPAAVRAVTSVDNDTAGIRSDVLHVRQRNADVVIVELGNAHTVVDLDTALVELFDQNFNVVTALERVLTVSAQTAVAGIRFKVMFGKTGVFKEVECFAGVLCDRMVQSYIHNK